MGSLKSWYTICIMKFFSSIFNMKKSELKSCITDGVEYGQTGPFTAYLKQRSLQKRIYFIRAQSELV